MSMKKLSIFTLIFLAVLSCGKSEIGERKDIIHVFDSLDSLETGRPLERSWISVAGGTNTYYVRCSVPFDVKWQDSGDNWGSVAAPEKIGDDLWMVKVSAKPLSYRTLQKGEAMYQKRYGVVLMSVPSVFLGSYLKVEQGMDVRRFDDFSSITGSEEPNTTHNDVLMRNWNAAQKGLGYTSTVLPGQPDSTAWVYGKDGYVKLGSDKAVGADFIMPAVPDLQNDTLVVLTFNAVAQNGDVLPDFQGITEPITPMGVGPRSLDDADDEMDNNVLTVRIEGGGYIRDFVEEGGMSITFTDLPTYDRNSPSYPKDIFNGSRYVVFIEGTDLNPLTVNTRIIFEAGDMSGETMEKCNRIFIDDICLFRASPIWDEDIFKIAVRSGKDELL